MNILPKKSWHVRNKDNIERVRRDEAQAAAEEKERQRRIALAESEARLSQLRGKSHKSLRDDEGTYEGELDTKVVELTSTELVVHSASGGGHVNLFEGIEADNDGKKNQEHEAEQKLAQQEWEKKVGILTYLGQSSKEMQADKPWYDKPSKVRKKEDTEHAEGAATSTKPREEMDRKSKVSLDPMSQMSRYLEVKRKQKDKTKGEKVKDTHKHKHKKKHKHDKAEREEKKISSGATTIEMLRAERMRREKEERLRTEQLLAQHEKGPGHRESPAVTDERQMRFNSQFNPDFVRRKRHRNDDYV